MEAGLQLDATQIVGSDFMAANAAALVFDEAGLGKTLQTVAACDKARLRRILVLCPTIVKVHWKREFQRFSVYDRSIEIIEGFPKKEPTADIVIASHAAATRPQHAALLQGPWEAVIVDEAHEARNWGSKLSQSLFGLESWSIWRKTSALWPLTGTPIVNSAFDLYPYIASGLSPYLPAMTSWDFMNEFTHVKRDFRGNLVPSLVKNEGKLWDVLKPFVLRRKSQIDIELRMQTFPLAIADEALKPIIAEMHGMDPEKIEQQLIDEIDVESEAISRVRHALGVAKAGVAAQYLQYLLRCHDTGPIVAFFLHTEVRRLIIEYLEKAGVRTAFIDGSNSAAAQQICDRYQAGEIDVILLQYRAGGTGLTLTCGNRFVAVESPWTYTAMQQAIARVRRKTQTKAVTADILFAQGCWLEEVQAKVIDRKMRTAMKILRS